MAGRIFRTRFSASVPSKAYVTYAPAPTGLPARDTAALQRAISAAGKGGTIVVPGSSTNYLLHGTLVPQDGQGVFCGAKFRPAADVTIWDFGSVLEVTMIGTLNMVDPDGVTSTTDSIRFRGNRRLATALNRAHPDG